MINRDKNCHMMCIMYMGTRFNHLQIAIGLDSFKFAIYFHVMGLVVDGKSEINNDSNWR